MSLPAIAAQQAIGQVLAISPFEGFLQVFNTNPYFIGLMMLTLNLGGRFISMEVTKKQEQFLQLPWVRRILIFTVLFVATRNIWVAFWMTITVVLFLGYLFNENSSLCIFGSGGFKGSSCSKGEDVKQDDMTPEEKEILLRLSSKAQRYQQAAANGQSSGNKSPEQRALNGEFIAMNGTPESDSDVLHTDIYAANLNLETPRSQ